MRSTARLTGAAKKTVERLFVAAGEACAKYHDTHIRNVQSKVVQLDEIWAFVGAKQSNTGIILRDSGVRGDMWTWVPSMSIPKTCVALSNGTRWSSSGLSGISLNFFPHWRH